MNHISKGPLSRLTLKKYDIVVIGGGPAGMMAAGRAAELGASVLLTEKNASLGRKLLLTGGGRCNVTNEKLEPRHFLSNLKSHGKFLFSAFSQHSVKDSLAFFHSRGLLTKVENEGRVFPVTDSARSVYDLLINYITHTKVDILTSVHATGLEGKEGKISALITNKGKIVAEKYILATGGTSLPETGSTGEGFDWLASLGHSVGSADSAMVPIKIADGWVRNLSGVSDQNAKLSLTLNGKKTETRRGRMLFAHFGITGPLVINFSKTVREALEKAKNSSDKIELSLDLLPDLDRVSLDKKIQEIFQENINKKLKNSLKDLSISPAMFPAIFELSNLDPEKVINVVTREERQKLLETLKDMRMNPTGFLGKDKAIVASGGADLKEINMRTMQSRLYSNLYVVGDVLDIERPSGGYSLQLCWTTGWVAATHASKKQKTDEGPFIPQN
eukprot:TRINITY_DN9903_c0_g1_i1.p1 TRINITY_DN9903_c0_g1~~TRINITY_DN9903_c0_g1_i1.p1  ORF type:complete len:445 (+),score=80.77 TRINITY_DN9903_c0_g1_i1:24-1358(+)